MTQAQIIKKVLEDDGGWVVSWKIIKVSTPYGWLGTSADRVARRLAEDGIIDRKIVDKYVYFKAKETRYKTMNVIGQNGEVEKQIRLPL